MITQADFLVIGSGVAGITMALNAARQGSVVMLTKRRAEDSASYLAQGGIAAVLSGKDSLEKHIQDTLTAGAGLCHENVVRLVVEQGPEVVRKMEEAGIRFTRMTSGDLDLGREGGHSERRIAHVEDFTGMHIVKALRRKVDENPGIRLLENYTAIDLILPSKFGVGEHRCVGCYALDNATGKVETFAAPCTVIATGGAGKVYLYTSNPDVASGDGIAMACRAGITIADMEFFQFHPTCLYHPESKGMLISEALRGEGGTLRRIDGQAFMRQYHPDGDLAPRDIVARAIDDQLKKTGHDYVLLDTTHIPADFIRTRFPNIHARCLALGIDITVRPIPVVPAAHYTCGGAVTDEWGKTSLPGLWCIGESACTGLHGANRLASNSLLEGLVMAERCAASAAGSRGNLSVDVAKVPVWDPGKAVQSSESVVVTQDWDEIRRFMWNYVGIVRSDRRLLRARKRLSTVREEIDEYYWNYIITSDLVELRNIATMAELIIESALLRKESRGLHYNVDFPGRDDAGWLGDTLIRVGEKPFLQRIDGKGKRQ
jgi:L-aspartate oxidase